MGRKRFNKFGSFGISQANQKRVILDSEKPRNRKLSAGQEKQYGARKREILSKLREIRELELNLSGSQQKWIGILEQACKKQKVMSLKQLNLMRKIYGEIRSGRAETQEQNDPGKGGKLE